MLGSSQSIAEPNIVLNTIMAEKLHQFADVLEHAQDFDVSLHNLVGETFRKHQRILFEGNSYSEQWKTEAVSRGLSNLPSTAVCLPAMITEKNIDLVVRHGIYTETEFRARYAIHLDGYNKTVTIEAKTMLDMATRQILPAALHYSHSLADTLLAKKRLDLPGNAESVLLQQLNKQTDALFDATNQLRDALMSLYGDPVNIAKHMQAVVIPCMQDVRLAADALETLTDKTYWPYPTYSDLLFY